MNYLRRHWYDIGGIICLIVVIIDIIFWKDFGTLRALLILNFASMLGHQYEEYGFPGGEPGVMNVADKHSDIPDRWPLNQNSAMWANLGCSYLFFLIPVFFPNVIWLGLAPMLAVFGQMVAHGVVNNRALKTWYNPGLADVILWQLPLTIVYICYIQSHHLTTIWTWIFAVVYLVAYMFFGINKLTYSWLANRNSKYPFAKVEMDRFYNRWWQSKKSKAKFEESLKK